MNTERIMALADKAALQAAIEALVQERDALKAELAKWEDANTKAGWINELRDHAKIGFAAAQERDELKLAYAECSRQKNELLTKHKQWAAENKVLMVSANALVHQIYIGDFVDSHGHSAKMLSAAIDLKNLLEQRND